MNISDSVTLKVKFKPTLENCYPIEKLYPSRERSKISGLKTLDVTVPFFTTGQYKDYACFLQGEFDEFNSLVDIEPFPATQVVQAEEGCDFKCRVVRFHSCWTDRKEPFIYAQVMPIDEDDHLWASLGKALRKCEGTVMTLEYSRAAQRFEAFTNGDIHWNLPQWADFEKTLHQILSERVIHEGDCAKFDELQISYNQHYGDDYEVPEYQSIRPI
jgi:hypothetical protein